MHFPASCVETQFYIVEYGFYRISTINAASPRVRSPRGVESTLLSTNQTARPLKSLSQLLKHPFRRLNKLIVCHMLVDLAGAGEAVAESAAACI